MNYLARACSSLILTGALAAGSIFGVSSYGLARDRPSHYQEDSGLRLPIESVDGAVSDLRNLSKYGGVKKLLKEDIELGGRVEVARWLPKEGRTDLDDLIAQRDLPEQDRQSVLVLWYNHDSGDDLCLRMASIIAMVGESYSSEPHTRSQGVAIVLFPQDIDHSYGKDRSSFLKEHHLAGFPALSLFLPMNGKMVQYDTISGCPTSFPQAVPFIEDLDAWLSVNVNPSDQRYGKNKFNHAGWSGKLKMH